MKLTLEINLPESGQLNLLAMEQIANYARLLERPFTGENVDERDKPERFPLLGLGVVAGDAGTAKSLAAKDLAGAMYDAAPPPPPTTDASPPAPTAAAAEEPKKRGRPKKDKEPVLAGPVLPAPDAAPPPPAMAESPAPPSPAAPPPPPLPPADLAPVPPDAPAAAPAMPAGPDYSGPAPIPAGYGDRTKRPIPYAEMKAYLAHVTAQTGAIPFEAMKATTWNDGTAKPEWYTDTDIPAEAYPALIFEIEMRVYNAKK